MTNDPLAALLPVLADTMKFATQALASGREPARRISLAEFQPSSDRLALLRVQRRR